MKTISKITLLCLSGIFVSAFIPAPGGEGFQIFLDNKVVVQQFGSDMSSLKTLELDKSAASQRLTIKYYHCGRSGKNRVVMIRDSHDKTLKTFHYPDTESLTAMEVPLAEVLRMKDIQELKLFYMSSQLPKGRTLVELKTTEPIVAKR